MLMGQEGKDEKNMYKLTCGLLRVCGAPALIIPTQIRILRLEFGDSQILWMKPLASYPQMTLGVLRKFPCFQNLT